VYSDTTDSDRDSHPQLGAAQAGDGASPGMLFRLPIIKPGHGYETPSYKDESDDDMYEPPIRTGTEAVARALGAGVRRTAPAPDRGRRKSLPPRPFRLDQRFIAISPPRPGRLTKPFVLNQERRDEELVVMFEQFAGVNVGIEAGSEPETGTKGIYLICLFSSFNSDSFHSRSPTRSTTCTPNPFA
jgi:hypothetical protein